MDGAVDPGSLIRAAFLIPRHHRKHPTAMPTAISESVLDNPIWNSLTTVHARFSQGGELARRFDPEIGPLAGLRKQSPEAYCELGELMAPGEIAVLFLDSEPEVPAGWRIDLHLPGDQMVSTRMDTEPIGSNLQSLGEADVAEMLALAKLTNPGQFGTRTIELGGFQGIREGGRGRLAAMAGQRMAWPGFVELSAVCTHPDFRGRGYARELVSAVAQAILACGETPMLHVFSSNRNAIRIYEGLGFVRRRSLHIAMVSPPASQA